MQRTGATNSVSRLTRVLDFAREHSAPKGLRLLDGTQPFEGLPGR